MNKECKINKFLKLGKISKAINDLNSCLEKLLTLGININKQNILNQIIKELNPKFWEGFDDK